MDPKNVRNTIDFASSEKQKNMDNTMKDEKIKNEKTEFAKEAHDPKEEYIFQKNGITKKGFFIIIAALVILGIALVISGVAF